jgi:hypothetical protein
MCPDHEAAREIDLKAHEAMKALVEMFSGPQPPIGKCRRHHREYDLVRFSEGTVGFVRNAHNAERDQMFAEIMELFGPEPAED